MEASPANGSIDESQVTQFPTDRQSLTKNIGRLGQLPQTQPGVAQLSQRQPLFVFCAHLLRDMHRALAVVAGRLGIAHLTGGESQIGQ